MRKPHVIIVFLFAATLVCLCQSCIRQSANDFAEQFVVTADKQPADTEARARLLLPRHPDDVIVTHKAYTLSYCEQHEQPRWVAYMLTRDHARGDIRRNDDFRPDPDVPTASAQPADYKNSGYTRGHLAPAGDMKWDTVAMSECFFMSNMSPQLADFNNGIWNDIEKRVRHWSRKYDTLYVVTGPVLCDGLPTIGDNKVSVPQRFFKVVYCPRRGEAIGFVVPHRATRTTAYKLAMSVDEVEKITGIDFFPDLPDDIEDDVEARYHRNRWDWQ